MLGLTPGDLKQEVVVRAPLAAYFLAAIIALIVIESLLVYRRRRVVEVSQ